MNKYISNFSFYLWILVVLFCATGCSKKYLNGTIYMGSGGGFAGSWEEYQLKASGDLFFRENRRDSLTFIKTLDSAATKKVFKKYYKLKLEKEDLYAPGNIYYFIGKRIGKFRNHRITFGDANASDLSKDLNSYYEWFMQSIQDTTKVINTVNSRKNNKFKNN
jgi:hypothetical protein